MGLRRRPPAAALPTVVGWAMLLMLLNAVVELFLGLVSSAGAVPLAALAYVLSIGFLIFAVGLARLRSWAWIGSLAWAALGTLGGLAALAATRDARYLPLTPAVALVVVLLPGVRRALS